MEKTLRQLRWQVCSEQNPLTHTYRVLIINSRREIARIEQRLKEMLQPTDDYHVLTEGIVTGSGLRYKAVQFDSYLQNPTEVNWQPIYQGTVVRDRNLDDRAAADGLSLYIDESITRGTFR